LNGKNLRLILFLQVEGQHSLLVTWFMLVFLCEASNKVWITITYILHCDIFLIWCSIELRHFKLKVCFVSDTDILDWRRVFCPTTDKYPFLTRIRTFISFNLFSFIKILLVSIYQCQWCVYIRVIGLFYPFFLSLHILMWGCLWFHVAVTLHSCVGKKALKLTASLCELIEAKMGFEPLNWYCKPEPDSIWEKTVDSAFGSYTPCAINTLVISTSNLVLMGLCLYRIWLIIYNAKAQRFCLKSNYYNYILGMLASYCAFQPLLRLLTGNSVFNLNEKADFAPFEVSLSYHTPMRSLCMHTQNWYLMLLALGLVSINNLIVLIS